MNRKTYKIGCWGKISEEKNIKEQFGRLGLYLIDRAEEKIKEFNQQSLYQKAEIKKNYLKKVDENSIRIKNQFREAYNNFLNESLTSNLIQAKESIINLKNNLLNDLKHELKNQLEEIIVRNYSNYLNFLNERIKSSLEIIDKPPKVIIQLNQKDFSAINRDISKIENLFKNKIEVISSKEDLIGGFKVILEDGKISYNYSIDNMLVKNFIIIEKHLSQIFSETEMEKLQINFERYIKNKKQEIKEYLKEYDQI
ncbi:MAG: V-type ATP synthase subunit E family protein [Promethearchaeota archaeon]